MANMEMTEVARDGHVDGQNQDEAVQDFPQSEISTRRLALLLGSLWFGALLVALDETMIATIAVPIATSLDAFSSFSWISTTYVIGSAVSQSLSGHLTDIVGRRKGIVVCYSCFAFGTLLCGLATNLGMFLTGRILQGMGGGGLSTIVAFVESDLIPMSRRALIEGIGNACYGVMLALGGVYGAGVYSQIGWKWAFLIQIPIMVIDAAIIYFTVKISDEKRIKLANTKVDFIGMFTLTSSLVLFQYGLSTGSVSSTWATPGVILPVCLALPLLGFFVYWETHRAANPVFPIRSILGRSVGSINLSAFLSTGAYTSCLFYVSVYLEIGGLSSLDLSLRLVPMAILFGVSSIVAGHAVCKLRRYWHLNIGLGIVSVVSYALLSSLGTRSPSWQPFFYLALLGIGFGGSFVTNLMGVLTSIPADQQAVVQSAQWASRSLGIAVSLTVSSVIFQSISMENLERRVPNDQTISGLADVSFLGNGSLAGLDMQTRVEVETSYQSGISAVFYYLLAQSALGTAVSFLIKNERLKLD
ncbi:MFS transporter-like protein 5 [Elsinoe australis]|uniref:MFS transporter-like protein 5 n=1 Tax=Elsinoe australis TaxID=40998 RepID=A0A4U7B6Y6_9PEZI|nr:MFS transporter-like protein 5 [Elsinoe australis]